MWRPRRPEGIRRLKLRQSTYRLGNQRKEARIMHRMTISESAEMTSTLKILLFVITVINPRDPLEHEDSRRGKHCYYNGDELCIATYNCFCIFRLMYSSPL